MRKIQILALALSVIASAPASALTTPQTQALDAALRVRDALVRGFELNDGTTTASDVAQEATKVVVKGSISALRRSGERVLADQYEREWEQTQSHSLKSLATLAALDEAGVDVKDLGDHKPLFLWLGRLHETLRTRLGSAAITQGLIGDVFAVAYAIPVVLSPRNGAWKQDQRAEGIGAEKDWIEYRRHFIPLMNVATYYGANAACKHFLAQSGMTNICGDVAKLLRHVMGRYLAPKMSDFVFKRANQQPASWNVVQSDFRYLNSAQLAQALGI